MSWKTHSNLWLMNILKTVQKNGFQLKNQGTFNIRLNSGLHKKVQLVLMKGITLNQLVQRAIKHEIEAESE